MNDDLVTEFLKAVEVDWHYAEAIAKDALIILTARAEGKPVRVWGRRSDARPQE